MKDYPTHTQASTPIAPGAQPFILAGGQTGILVIHGYGGTAADYRLFASNLQKFGYTVMVMRVAGHGQGLEALRKTHAADWRQSVIEAATELQSRCSSIVIVGSSFGGILGLDYAVHRPRQTLGVVTVNAPTSYRGWGALQPLVLRFLRLFMTDYPKFGLSTNDRERYRQLGSTTAWPIDGIIETGGFFSRYVAPTLPQIDVPALFMANEHDPLVSGQSLDRLYASLASQRKVKMTIPGRTHRPFRDTEATKFISQQVDAFITSIAKPGAV